MGMESFSLFLINQGSLGANSFRIPCRHKSSSCNLLAFLNCLANYNLHHPSPIHKKVSALLIKLYGVLGNLCGVSLLFYWLSIDFDAIKIFITSVGVMVYGGMKIYEKYLDIKEQKRKSQEQKDSKNKHKY